MKSLYTKTTALALMLSSFLAASASLNGQTRLLELIDETAEVAVSTRSLEDLGVFTKGFFQMDDPDSDGGSSWQEMLKHLDEAVGGEMGAFFEEIATEGAGISSIFADGMVFSVHNLSKAFAGAMDEIHFVLLAEYRGDRDEAEATLKKALDIAADHREKEGEAPHILETVEFMGTSISVGSLEDADSLEMEPKFAYALVDNLLIASTEVFVVEAHIESLLTGTMRERRLMDTPGYLGASEQVPDSMVNIYLNTGRIFSAVNDLIRDDLGEMLIAIGLNAEVLIDTLGLELMEGMRFGAEVPQDAAVEMRFALSFAEKAGVLSLLNYGPRMPAAPAFVPENALSSDYSSFSISGAFEALEALVNQVNPIYGGIFAMQLEQIRLETGVDLRGALIGNIRDSLVSYSVPMDSGSGSGIEMPASVYVLDLLDGVAFNEALETLKGLVPGGSEYFAASEIDGATIYHFRDPEDSDEGEPSSQFGYVVTRDRVIASDGPPHLLRSAFQRINRASAPGEGLWNQAWLGEYLDVIAAPNAYARGYLNLGAMVGEFSEAFLLGASLDAATELPYQAMFERLRGLDYYLLSESHANPNSFSVRVIMFEKPER